MGLRTERQEGESAEPFEIVPTLEADDMMLAAAAYVFWPLLALPLLWTRRGQVPFVRFHSLQALWFGIGSVVFLTMVSVATWFTFRYLPQSDLFGVAFVAIFVGWLALLLMIFMLTLFFAYRAGQGHVFKIPVLGQAAEARVRGYFNG